MNGLSHFELDKHMYFFHVYTQMICSWLVMSNRMLGLAQSTCPTAVTGLGWAPEARIKPAAAPKTNSFLEPFQTAWTGSCWAWQTHRLVGPWATGLDLTWQCDETYPLAPSAYKDTSKNISETSACALVLPNGSILVRSYHKVLCKVVQPSTEKIKTPEEGELYLSHASSRIHVLACLQ
jgi:hypothetical protein